MDVRIGIVSWQTAGLLERCLSHIPAALGSLDGEVVVVDNASTDSSSEVARRFAATVVSNDVNIGYARAMNVALRDARAPFLIALNPDTMPPPGSLETLVSRLRADPGLGIVVPRLVNEDGSPQPSVHRFPSVRVALVMGLVPFGFRRGPIGRHFWLRGFADLTRRQRIDWAIGAVHVIRRAALRDEGHAYPERSFMYGEDMALCWDLRRDGWGVEFEPASEIVHTGGAAARQKYGTRIDAFQLTADYGWYRSTFGTGRTRLWAAANMLGYGAKLAVARVIWRRDDPRARRTRRFLRLHARHIVSP
jgi:N-acetylglucosaminyl-diphospho-decaprenol L-rhamnosyltransferase